MTEQNIDSSKAWYAVRTKPRKETVVASLLKKAGIETYLPRIQVEINGQNCFRTHIIFCTFL